ncbi:MAG: hypothetical protein RJB65_1977 [Actinomycetota bacterium]
MPFPQRNLNRDETIALDMHPHWWFFAKQTAVTVVVVILSLLAIPKDKDWMTYPLVVLLVIVGAWLAIRYLKWVTTNFVITSQRVIFREGVIAKKGIEIPLERVNNVNFNQGIVERILGAGDLLIESGGEDGKQRFTDIRHPEAVQNLIHAQMEAVAARRGGYSRAEAPAAVADPTGQLERLADLLDRGVITQDEFDAQKARLLG